MSNVSDPFFSRSADPYAPAAVAPGDVLQAAGCAVVLYGNPFGHLLSEAAARSLAATLISLADAYKQGESK
jgi:hypothetical protein